MTVSGYVYVCCRMRIYIVGNSIVRGFTDNTFTTTVIPGAGWQRLKEYILNNIDQLRDGFVYVHVGPVRFTRVHQTNNRREVVLDERSTRWTPEEMWTSVRNRLREVNSHLVICTLYPIEFSEANEHIARRNNSRLIMRAFYRQWGRRLRGMVVVENRRITRFNERNGVMTPFMHKKIFLRRRRHYVFRGNRFLCDGVHPTTEQLGTWINEIVHAHRINVSRWIRRN